MEVFLLVSLYSHKRVTQNTRPNCLPLKKMIDLFAQGRATQVDFLLGCVVYFESIPPL